MILKTSLFNKGIYKSTLRRYLWGGVLYFIMLFLFTGMMILLNEDPNQLNAYWSNRGGSTLLGSEYMIIPMLMSIVVPTIAGLLIFRYIHSKKTSVFVHSLPVKRGANFVSSVLSALTLMAVPVVLNTLILIIMSLAAYSALFSVGDCITWMLLNLFSLFVMFSCVCFVASITGNSFAMIGLNVIFHSLGLILAAAFTMVSEIFLFGFAGEGFLIDKVFNNSFITRIPTIMTSWGYVTDKVYTGYIIDIVIFIITALVLYAFSGFLYAKRRMETAEDVAGFGCLNHIFKYMITFVGAIAAFAIFCFSIYESPLILWLMVLIISAVIYFGVEMILKKTLRVWKSYKGYLGFAAAFALVMCVFSLTSFFGFETYIPKGEKVKSVAVYNYYNREKPLLDNEELINKALLIHNEFVNGRTLLTGREYDSRIHIEYHLDNGRTIHRVYQVTEDRLHQIMESLYKNKEYKEALEEIYTPMESVYKVSMQSGGQYVDLVDDKEKMKELVDLIKKDVDNLSYSQMNNEGWSFSVEINYLPVEKKIINLNGAEVTRSSIVGIDEVDDDIRVEYMHQSINPNYVNTINWIKENGYWENISLKNDGTLYIARNWKDLPFVDEEGRLVEIIPEKENFIKIEDKADIKRLIDYAQSNPSEYIPSNKRFRVFQIVNENTKDYNSVTVLSKEEIAKLFPDSEWHKLN